MENTKRGYYLKAFLIIVVLFNIDQEFVVGRKIETKRDVSNSIEENTIGM